MPRWAPTVLLRAVVVAAAGVLGAAAATELNGTTLRMATPREVAGPFFLDLRKIRRDVTNGRPGVPLYLDLKVLGNCWPNGSGCRPKEDALVDIWHADSRGVYSGVFNEGVNATGRDFFRGSLLTRRDGSVTFRTIVPGWYWTRLAHVHLKVRGSPPPPRGSPAGRQPNAGFVTQLFFPPPFLRRVYSTGVYAARSARGGDGDAYTATVATDFELRGNGGKFRALQVSLRPVTVGWLRANAFPVPPRWQRRQGVELGYIASYTLRLKW
ncbi:hypothetical protein MMPV_004994 [Pyropia vietnamensis]